MWELQVSYEAAAALASWWGRAYHVSRAERRDEAADGAVGSRVTRVVICSKRPVKCPMVVSLVPTRATRWLSEARSF